MIDVDADSISFVKVKKDKSKVVTIAIPADFNYLKSRAITGVRDELGKPELKDTCVKDDSGTKCLKHVSSILHTVLQSCYL